ncbi:hypothetical protein BCV69DRAFT_279513 [Microstroma glucosiphilum]|uniref:Pre-mRNA-splicing factor CWC24 n=1 Tax=Pseudomicrostroma glucosiphilum TaxID=1684307 RepID=A0A316UGX5_9BASI|nr:hypothetical protein BCV69DRAFT_279513 [Pseudomicrostroma glucosiphilum]PWN23581.1 hypothetical protein BCV69DRAFT_279513 [Pseudomicrostroma glucosiphilum]
MASPEAGSAVASSSTSSAAPLFKKKRARPTPAVATSSSSNFATSSAASTSAATSSTGRASRNHHDDDEDDDASSSRPTVVQKARKVDYSNPLIQSTGFSLAKRNRLAAEQAAEEEGDDPLLTEDEYSSVSARVKAGGAGVLGSNRDDATRGVDWFDEEESSAKKPPAPPGSGTNDDGVYRGLSSYSSALPQSDHKNKYTQRGPIRAPTNIRTVTVVDYQPDVCKDYKETGYCGFGDTCKFLHDRSDYLAGWQMEAAYLPNSTSRRDLGPGEEDADEDDDEEEIPFACLLCRQPFTDPVQTRCGHYFCSACAIKRFSKTPKCFACGAQTGGIFNSATKVIERMEKRRRDKDEQKREIRRGWGAEEDTDGAILAGVEVGAQQEDDDA